MEEVVRIRRARESERDAGIGDRIVSRRAEVTVDQEDGPDPVEPPLKAFDQLAWTAGCQ